MRQVGVGNPPPPGVQKNEIRFHSLHHPVGHRPGKPEEAGGFCVGEFVPPGDMALGDDEAVALGIGMDVEKTRGIDIDLPGQLPDKMALEMAAENGHGNQKPQQVEVE
jgi:hypothetical protein